MNSNIITYQNSLILFRSIKRRGSNSFCPLKIDVPDARTFLYSDRKLRALNVFREVCLYECGNLRDLFLSRCTFVGFD